MMKGAIIFTSIFVAIAFMYVSATIINIPSDYPTIQEGINASNDGDTVLVQPGTYVENINFNGHNIVLGSLFLTTGDTSYISLTIIDGDSVGTVVKFNNGEDSTTIIKGFTIRNGYGLLGGGIKCYYSNPQIVNNRISENSASNHGGGISCESSNPTITNNTISNNSANGGAGGIEIISNSNPLITNNIISNNSAHFGGAIECYANSNPTIINNIVDNNFACYGGGINIYGSSNTIIYNNIISGNSADWSGGGIDISGADLIISNNVFSENSAHVGGGIYCFRCSPTLINNTITGNSAESDGGGICCTSCSVFVAMNTIFWSDSAQNGSEIYLYDSSPIISYCDIQGGWEGEGNIDCDPLFCYPDTVNFYLAENSCCVGAGCDSLGNPDSTVNIGAFGVGCAAIISCDYTPGDINGDGNVMGNDVTYGVRYFKGLGNPPPDSCWNNYTSSWLYSAGDANGNCRFTGSDITFLVAYGMGYNPEILWCPQTPPIGPVVLGKRE